MGDHTRATPPATAMRPSAGPEKRLAEAPEEDRADEAAEVEEEVVLLVPVGLAVPVELPEGMAEPVEL
jgi:hypothetical protein